jgi:tol-pal system protein YbgF
MMASVTNHSRRFGAGTLACVLLAALPAQAANKDIDRLAMQIATLQSQLSEIQRSSEETRAELKRLSELIAEQNALLRKNAADKRQTDEALATGLKELSERVSELGEALQAIKATFPLPPAGPATITNAAPTTDSSSAAAGTPPVGSAPTAPAAPVAPTGPPPAPRELYSQAYADYARGNYDLAMQGFAEYLRAYPGTDFADNAQYWIGECLYGKKMYAEAIEAWNTLLKDFPSSDKLPDARVKKGMALERLGRKSQALVEYRYVVDRYPTSQAARIARERLNP